MYDREWAVVDVETGAVATLKSHPSLALIRPSLDITAGNLILDFIPGENTSDQSFDRLVVPFSSSGESQSIDKVNATSVRVCGDTCGAFDMGASSRSWLTKYLGRACSLVRAQAAVPRLGPCSDQQSVQPQKQQFVKNNQHQHVHHHQQEEDQTKKQHEQESKTVSSQEVQGQERPDVAFANKSQFLLVSEDSVADLNTRLDSPVDAHRFRPNIVVSGAKAYAEDQWAALTITEIDQSSNPNKEQSSNIEQISQTGSFFVVSEGCSRCVVVNVDGTGSKELKSEPLRTLSKYRRVNKDIFFGVYLYCPDAGRRRTVLRVGSVVSPVWKQ